MPCDPRLALEQLRYVCGSGGKAAYSSTCWNFAVGNRVLAEYVFLFCECLINPDMDDETEYIAKKRTNRAFQRYVCRTEILSIFCIRNGISHCEKDNKNPTNVLFRLEYVDPHLIQQCLGPPQAPPQIVAPTVEALSHTYAVKSPLVTMLRSKFAPKSTPSRGPIAKPQNLPHPWTRPT